MKKPATVHALGAVSQGIQRASEGLDALKVAAGDPAGLGVPHEEDVYTGSYSIYASDLSLVANAQRSSNVSSVTLSAQGSATSSGLIQITSSDVLEMRAGNSGILMVESLLNNSLAITNESPGELVISQGGTAIAPRMKMYDGIDSGVELKVGLSTLVMTPKGVEIKCGLFSIKMDATTGISLKAGPSEINLDLKGIETKGIKASHDGGLNMDLNGVSSSLGSGGIARLDSAIKNV